MWVVMVMMMRVVMVMVRRLRTLVSTLRQAGCHTTVVNFCFAFVDLLSSPAIFLPSPSELRSRSSFVMLVSIGSSRVAFRITGRGESRWRSRTICVLARRGSRTAHAASEAREHSAKLTFDAWIISSRSDVLWLRSLDSLR